MVLFCTAKFCIVIVWLIARTCWSEIIIESPDPKRWSSLVEAAVEIVTSCYENQFQTVGLAGKTSETFLKKLWSQNKYFPAASIDVDFRKLKNPLKTEKSHSKLQLFVVVTPNPTELKPILERIKTSPWWNHMASFLIIDRSAILESDCSQSSKLLWTAWEMNLLDAKSLCIDQTNERLIYTYNPYTSRAPSSWHPSAIFPGKNGHPWTLLVRRFENVEKKFCDDLNFDKTKNLGGYEIRSIAKDIPGVWRTDTNKTGIDSFGKCDGTIARYIFQALNATPNLKAYSLIDGPGFTSGNVKDILTELTNDRGEIILNPRPMFPHENSTMTYPSTYVDVHIATQQRGQESQLSKIMSVIDVYSRIGLLIVAILTLLFFKFFLRRPSSSAIIDLLRIICNSGLLKLPKNSSARIYLSAMFFLYVTILGIYQGKIASVLTKPKALKNVDTKQDLSNLGYTIYGQKMLHVLFKDSAFQGRFIGVDDFSCLDYAMSDPANACISTRTFIALMNKKILRDDAKLHSSRDAIASAKMIYVIRKDWPLERRLNEILMTLFETHVITKITMREYEEMFAAEKFNECLAEKEKFNVIILDELIFAFVFLGFGLMCACVCFVVEVAIGGHFA